MWYRNKKYKDKQKRRRVPRNNPASKANFFPSSHTFQRFQGIYTGNNFSERTPKAVETKLKIDEEDYIKLK